MQICLPWVKSMLPGEKNSPAGISSTSPCLPLSLYLSITSLTRSGRGFSALSFRQSRL